jgi:hypothetical protein
MFTFFVTPIIVSMFTQRLMIEVASIEVKISALDRRKVEPKLLFPSAIL